MRERLHALDGHLDAGPDPAGGWRLRAVVPALAGPAAHPVDG